MKNIVLAITIVGSMIATGYQQVLIESMKVVDYIGYKTNTNVVNVIDDLNTLYYMLE